MQYNAHPYLKGLPYVAYIVFAYNFAAKLQKEGENCGPDPTNKKAKGWGDCAEGLKCKSSEGNVGGASICVDENEPTKGICYN